jgi:hypothetical protein
MNEQEIQQRIMKEMTSGNYADNLTRGMKYAAMAVEENSTDKINYLLLQSIAQSLISLNLLIEDLVGYQMEGDE